jgi:hypothetical protein
MNLNFHEGFAAHILQGFALKIRYPKSNLNEFEFSRRICCAHPSKLRFENQKPENKNWNEFHFIFGFLIYS